MCYTMLVKSLSVVDVLNAGRQATVIVSDGNVSVWIQQGSTIVHVKILLKTLGKKQSLKILDKTLVGVQLEKTYELQNYIMKLYLKLSYSITLQRCNA